MVDWSSNGCYVPVTVNGAPCIGYAVSYAPWAELTVTRRRRPDGPRAWVGGLRHVHRS